MNTYEILAANEVSFAQVAVIFSEFTNISLDKIGTRDEYYNQLDTTRELEIGIDISYFDKGYKTFLNVVHINFEIQDYQLVKLACQLAKTLKTNVAIGDTTDDEGFAYLIISADKKYQKAYESRNNDDENVEFDPYTEKADIDEILKILDNS